MSPDDRPARPHGRPLHFKPDLMDQEPHIQIDANPRYLEAESRPEALHFVFAYTITISNHGPMPAQLLQRHWVITDAQGKVQEVRGEGVVGETPRLEPGEAFRYTSAAVIATPTGMMQGEYRLRLDSGEWFEAEIPPFALAVPGALH
jgi:ApaG protein